ncbi:MAG: hypothetical protein CVU15_03675 [Betaproteobacteria bacterium HGW-Betaproteobacteria-1]|jgi:hypothetical protein|nr:MAG: hypothetical protein CVU15_03675 [Betaproteobacteria bacterium HGW-Betaproteobacteria-1]
MRIFESWRSVLSPSPETDSKESRHLTTINLFWAYVVPLALITPVMLSIVVREHEQQFIDILPGDRLYILGFILFIAQICLVPLMAFLVKNTATMINIKPSFDDAFLVMAISATPFFVVSVFYLVPSFAFNIVMHGVAAAASSLLVYLGIKNVFNLQRRGARIMLTMTVLSAAALGFGILLIGTLIVWEEIQIFQFAAS